MHMYRGSAHMHAMHVSIVCNVIWLHVSVIHVYCI